MKVKAKQTLKNAYDQVLFMAGKTYNVTDTDDKRLWVFNELHSETPIRKSKLDRDFEVVTA